MSTAAQLSTQESLLQVKELQVSFDTRRGDVHAVRGVNLEVAPEQTLAIVGESGSGKSVTMMAALGLLPDNARVSGQASFDGSDLVAMPEQIRRRIRGRDIGIVFQDPLSSLNPVHRIVDQVAESLIVHQRKTRRTARKLATELLEEVGIPDAERRSRDYPHQFSGGMRQRVMLAMALACQPRLLIADEPTTALDVTVQAQITDLVRRLQQEHGMAMIWITHDLGVVAQLADRVSVMYAGQVVETGDCAQIYQRPQHPYSVGLLTAVPRLDAPLGRELLEIAGSPPDPQVTHQGCSFAPRCFMATDACTTTPVELVSAEPGHASACLHTEEVPSPHQAHRSGQHIESAHPDEDDAHLQVNDLRVHFGATGWLGGSSVVRAVDGVDLQICPGEVLGLVGESGSGKSTLGRAVVGIEPTTDGTIEIGTVDRGTASRAEQRQLTKRVQMVFQDPASSMNPSLTVEDIIEEPLRINRIGTRSQRHDRVTELLELVEVPVAARDRHPHEFSGGQRQRIAIARALALKPDLLVCDEAVSALDVSVQAQIINLFSRLRAELGVAMLFIAHDLAVVRHVSDHVAVMYLGQIVEHGSRDQVYENPLHPYTQALLSAVPLADPTQRDRYRLPVTGELPSPVNPPAGCRFNTRCPFARPGLCDTEAPPLVQHPSGQKVACHLVDELPTRA